jgi:hypothetical protein
MLRIRKYIKKRGKLPAVGIALVMALAMVMGTAIPASAAGYDLLTRYSWVGPINGAYFESYTPKLATGTGSYDSFLRIQKNNSEKGYNTDGTIQFDTKGGIWTHAIELGAIPIVTDPILGADPDASPPIPGTVIPGEFYELRCDTNENGQPPSTYLTLKRLQIWMAPAPGGATITGYVDDGTGFPAGATLVWSLDTGGNSWINMNYDLNPGSGGQDNAYYVPTSYFSGWDDTDYFVLFAEFGKEAGHPTDTYDTADGFEEWGVVYTCCGVTLHNVPTGGDRGCNNPPSCDAGVTATDACNATLSVTCTPGPITGVCNKSQTFTYSASDSCNNTATADVTYTWKEDTTDPVLDDLPAGGDLGCNPTLPVCDTGVTASDNCDGDISGDVVCTPGQITDVGICGKQQIFNYYVEDACGNNDTADVTYTWKEDTTPPEIICPPDIDMECSECTFDPTYTGWAEAVDNCDGTIIPTYEDIYDSGEGCPRSIIREWTATDDCGNNASCTQIIRCYKQGGCETACAANGTAGKTRFPGANNWFTWITYNNVGGAEVDYPIYAGKDQPAGTLHVKVEGGVLKVRYEGTDSSGCESVFSEYHLQVERTFNALRTAICNRNGSPVPGRCKYTGSPNGPDTGWISTANVSGWANPIYIFAHSVACSTCYAPLPPD